MQAYGAKKNQEEKETKRRVYDTVKPSSFRYLLTDGYLPILCTQFTNRLSAAQLNLSPLFHPPFCCDSISLFLSFFFFSLVSKTLLTLSLSLNPLKLRLL